MRLRLTFLALCASAAPAADLPTAGVQFQPVELTFDGPQASEDGTPNPFTDYRMSVVFSQPAPGRLVVAHETHITGGFGAEIAATVAEKGAYFLDAPPVRVGHMDVFWGPAQLESWSMITRGASPPKRVTAERPSGMPRSSARDDQGEPCSSSAKQKVYFPG